MTRKCQRKSPVKSNVPTDMLPEIDEFEEDTISAAEETHFSFVSEL